VGITKFCVHPQEWRQSKTIVGGTKNVDHIAIDKLRPDLIIANKEENTKEDVERLQMKFPVHVTEVSTIESAFEMMLDLGKLTGTTSKAEDLVVQIKMGFNDLPQAETRDALYLIWKKPWMAAGNDTFIHSMMELAGFRNVIGQERYPQLTTDQVVQLAPEIVLLSTEPYPFKDQHVEELQKLLPHSKVVLVDGEMFSWYGSRMVLAAEYLSRMMR
jgi:ABC-type Fe3+-hydroxamate transport system substrate-binding protein